MSPDKQDLDFADVLAAAVHDMKNSLGLLLQSIDTLRCHIPEQLVEAHQHIGHTHYEANRLNSNLVQLLTLYKNDTQQLPTYIDEYSINSVFDEIVSANKHYAEQNNIELDAQIDSDINWFFDSELVYLLLNDAVINALRYGNKKVLLSASIVKTNNGDKLSIVIEDDGVGYPESMISNTQQQTIRSGVKNGRTGLGLFFAKLIAQAHENNGRHGEITLSNGGKLGGSVFLVNLP